MRGFDPRDSAYAVNLTGQTLSESAVALSMFLLLLLLFFYDKKIILRHQNHYTTSKSFYKLDIGFKLINVMNRIVTYSSEPNTKVYGIRPHLFKLFFSEQIIQPGLAFLSCPCPWPT